MKKLNSLLYRVGGFMTGSFLIGSFTGVQAQSQVALRLSFNTEQNRYEVFAKPDFSAKNFTWGPSQVSVVVPTEVANEPLSIRSTNVGSWSDNSMIYAPNAAPGTDFHGMTTSGGKIDLVAGEEQLLFDFTLKSGFVDKVRLFDGGADPGSERTGMKGGDFHSYMSDEKGVDYLHVDSRSAALVVVAPAAKVLNASEAEGDVQLVAYPNPSASGKFRLYLKGFQPEEVVTVRFVKLNGSVYRSFDEKVETLAGRLIDAGSSEDNYVLMNLERQTDKHIFTRKLWVR